MSDRPAISESLSGYLRSISQATAYVHQLEARRDAALAAGAHERADELTEIAEVLKVEISEAMRRGDDESLVCTECGRNPRADENALDDWRAVSDGLGELHVFCPECWQREFGAGT